MQRSIDRLRPSILIGGTFLVTALGNVLAAWWVIRERSPEVWGEFVEALILAGLAIHVLNWGSHEFLLRAFARHPGQAGPVWRQNLVTRGALLFIALPAVLLAGFSMQAAAYLLLWIFAGFVRRSFQPVIAFRKEFGFEMGLEMAAAAVLLGGLVLQREVLSGEIVMRWFALAWVVRALGVLLKYGREFLPGVYPRIQFRYFQVALPFFLLGFAGMLLSRADVYCVALFIEGKAPLANYQILMGFFIYLQTVAGFLVVPHAKNYYRLPDQSMFRLARRLILPGLGITLAGLVVVALVVEYAYGIRFGWWFYALGGLYILPTYYYSPLIYLLFKRERQRQVVQANGAAILLNIGLNLALIPHLGLLGAVLATSLAQVLNSGLIVWFARKPA